MYESARSHDFTFSFRLFFVGLLSFKASLYITFVNSLATTLIAKKNFRKVAVRKTVIICHKHN